MAHEPGKERQVTEAEFYRHMLDHNARRDPAWVKQPIGDVERWIFPGGSLAGRIEVRYWKGEEDFDYYIIEPVRAGEHFPATLTSPIAGFPPG